MPMADEAKGRRPPADYLLDVFENGAMALHLVGPDGSILYANRAELELLGYEPDEYVGRAITDFHDDPDAIADILARLSRGETLDKYPARLRAKDGLARPAGHERQDLVDRVVAELERAHASGRVEQFLVTPGE